MRAASARCSLDAFVDDKVPNEHAFGPLKICPRCRAILIETEQSICCTTRTFPGLTGLEVNPQPPAITQIFTNTDNRFLLRKLNQIHSFTSLGSTRVDHALANANQGVYTFRVQGQMHHYISRSLLPPNGSEYSFGQLYFHDSAAQAEARHALMTDLPLDLLVSVANVMINNPFVQIYCQAKQMTHYDRAHAKWH